MSHCTELRSEALCSGHNVVLCSCRSQSQAFAGANWTPVDLSCLPQYHFIHRCLLHDAINIYSVQLSSCVRRHDRVWFAGRCNFRLSIWHCHYDLRKLNFSNRVIPVWNSLTDYVVRAETVNTFKNRLDRHWSNQEVLFDYNADLYGIGNRSIMLKDLSY